MNIANLTSRSKHLVSENSTTILTSIGVTGTITTAYLTGKASIKAHQILERERDERSSYIDRSDELKLVWQEYIPAVGMGSLTIASIIMANRMSSKEAAALAAAYGLSERAFAEYKTKVIEKIGENKERAVRDEVAQDRVTANPIGREVIISGPGEVLCYDMLTDRYFKSSVEEIKRAQNKINETIINGMYASLGSFYDLIGLRPTGLSEELGWNTNNLLDVQFSTVMSPDDRPCLAMDFAHPPVADYQQLY